MGSLGMAVIFQDWSDTVRVIGAMNILVGWPPGLGGALGWEAFRQADSGKKLQSRLILFRVWDSSESRLQAAKAENDFVANISKPIKR